MRAAAGTGIRGSFAFHRGSIIIPIRRSTIVIDRPLEENDIFNRVFVACSLRRFEGYLALSVLFVDKRTRRVSVAVVLYGDRSRTITTSIGYFISCQTSAEVLSADLPSGLARPIPQSSGGILFYSVYPVTPI